MRDVVAGSEAALSIEGLSKSYRGTPAISALSLQARQGEMTVLLGPAGAGKTTTLRLIAGLEGADAGRIVVAGRDVAGAEPRDRNLAMIFDNLALYPDKTGFGNIASALRIRGLPPPEIEVQVNAMAALLRIPHVLSRLPRTMSGGERQRVALGRALVRNPALFLLDEPLSSLDAMLRIELRAELRRLQREQGHSFLLATPDFAEALAIADRVVMLRTGTVVQTCDPQTLYEEPADREVARFVGSPQINLVPAHHDQASGLLTFGGMRLAVPDLPVEGPFEAGIRPEDLHLTACGAGHFDAPVTDIEPLGQLATVSLAVTGGEVRLVAPMKRAASLSVGEIVGIRLDLGRLHCFDPQSGLRMQR